jgi:hypothetical protein
MRHLLVCALVGFVIAPFWTQVEARDDDIVIPSRISLRFSDYRLDLTFLGDGLVRVKDSRECSSEIVSFY